MYDFSLKVRCIAFQSTAHQQRKFSTYYQVSYDGQAKHTLPVRLSNHIKHLNIVCFFNIHETCLSFYFEVLYSWNESFFQGIELQEKGAGGTFVEQTNLVPPTLMRTVGFVRREEWLEYFFLF